MSRIRSRRCLALLALAAGSSLSSLSLAASGTWLNPASGTWSDPSQWVGGTVADGIDSTGTFNLDLTSDVTIQLDSARTLGALLFGDTATATPGSWILGNNGNPANVLTLATSTTAAPLITVNALGSGSAANIAAVLAGTQGLTKAGAGMLVLSAAESVTGNISVSAGGLSLAAGSSLNTGGALNTTATSGARVSVDGGTATFAGTSTISGSKSNTTATTTTFALNSGSATFGTLQTDNNPRAIIQVAGGTLTANTVTVQRNSNSTSPDYTSGFIVTGGNVSAGSVGIGTANSTGAMSVDGGNVTISGTLTVANQATSGRGGGLRVLSGSLSANEFDLCKTSGTNSNNLGSATFSGGISSFGTFLVGYDSTVNAGSGTVNLSGGTLYLGSGGLMNNGTSGFTALANLNSGILGASADFTSNVNMNLPAGSTAVVQAADAASAAHNITLAGNIGGAGPLTKTGAGSLTLAGSNSYIGLTTVSAGSLVASTASLPGDVLDNGNLTFAQATVGTYVGNISGSGSLTKTGGGLLVLANTPGQAGATVVAGGVLQVHGALASSSLSIQNGAGLALGSGGATVATASFGAAAGDTMTLSANDGSGVVPLVVTGTNGFSATGSTTISVGSAGLTLGLHPLIDYNGSLGGTGFSAFTLGALPPRVTASLFNDTANSSIDLNVTALDYPRWTGAVNGDWDINATQNWVENTSGKTTVYLQSPPDQVLFNDKATGSTSVNLTTTLQPNYVTVDNSTLSYTFSGAGKISGTTGLTKSGSGTLVLANTGGNDFTGNTTLQGGTLSLGADNVLSPNSTVVISGSATLDMASHSATLPTLTMADGTLAGPGTLNASTFDLRKGTVAATLAGTGTLIKSTTDTVMLNTPASYSGATSVQAGTLRLGADNALPIGTVATLGAGGASGSIDLNGHSQTLSGLNTTGLGTANSVSSSAPATLTISGGDSYSLSSSYAGSIDGAISLVFSGTGTLTLAGNSTYTGGTTVNLGGTLALASGAALGAVPASPATSVTFTSSPATLRAAAPAISLAANQGIFIDGITLSVDTGGSANTMTINGVISGAHLAKVGNGTLVLTNANTYSGNTTISSGNLKVTNNQALSTSNIFLSGSSCSLQLGDGVTLTNAFDTTSNSDNMIDVPDPGATATFAGNITEGNGSGTGNQFRPAATGAGATLVLTGNASLPNVMIVPQGNVVLASTATLANAGAVTVGRVNSSTKDASLTIRDSASLTAPSLALGGGASGNSTTSLNSLGLTLGGSGSLTLSGSLDLLNVAGTTAGSSLNLNGGTLSAASFIKTTPAFPTVINFNGGTLRAAAASSAFLPAFAQTTGNVQGGGAIIDTNGNDITLAVPLGHAAGSTGGLTKLGAGNLTLGAFDLGGPLSQSAGQITATGALNRASSLSLPASTRLDLAANRLVLTAFSSTDLASLLFSGRNGGTWDGASGIFSSTAATDASRLTAIGYATASALGLSTFSSADGSASISVNPADLLVRFTWYGDLNLDGKVNADDYALLDRGLARHLAGWSNGDVNYDGVVNSADFLLVDTSFGKLSGQLPESLLSQREAQFGPAYVAALTAAVPEPASLGLLALGAVGVLRRRRRR